MRTIQFWCAGFLKIVFGNLDYHSLYQSWNYNKVQYKTCITHMCKIHNYLSFLRYEIKSLIKKNTFIIYINNKIREYKF